MHKLTILLFGVALWSSCSNQKPHASEGLLIDTKLDSVSYALGVNMASNVTKQGFEEIDEKLFSRGVLDQLNGRNDTIMTAEEAIEIITEFYYQKREGVLAKIAQESKDFLKQNGKRKGVVTLPSGVQYEIIKVGNGAKPKATDNVKCHYKAMLIDSTEYKNTADMGSPVMFPVNGALKGLTEALQLMPGGSIWKIYIPAKLAYGRRPPVDTPIKPNMAVIYELELLKIERPSLVTPK
jgi:FKBP-type peptidyl-prolyl cis-trans isomerase FklB